MSFHERVLHDVVDLVGSAERSSRSKGKPLMATNKFVKNEMITVLGTNDENTIGVSDIVRRCRGSRRSGTKHSHRG